MRHQVSFNYSPFETRPKAAPQDEVLLPHSRIDARQDLLRHHQVLRGRRQRPIPGYAGFRLLIVVRGLWHHNAPRPP